MKQNLKPGRLIVYINLLAAVILSPSCVKDYRDGETNFSNVQPSVIIAEGGLSGNSFSNAALTFPGTDSVDTAHFHVNYAATNVAPTDEQVNLAVDSNALASYNGLNGLQYELMPDSDYSFTATQVTVPKGNNYTSAIPVTFYPDKIDPSKNFMLPISITSAPSGTIMSNNQNTIYFHAIGNPIAGTYEQYWSRWNASDSSGGSATALYYKYDVGPVVFAPNSPTQVQVTSQGTGETNIIDFENNNGVLSNFTVTIPNNVAGITIGTGNMDAADPAAGYYRVSFPYVNSSNLPRTIVNEYIKH